VSLPYDAALTLFGGTAPPVAEFLATDTGSKQAPAFYVIAAAGVCPAAVFTMRETAHEALS
jgi:MFS transporter, MHS family, proline/betaine transporter